MCGPDPAGNQTFGLSVLFRVCCARFAFLKSRLARGTIFRPVGPQSNKVTAEATLYLQRALARVPLLDVVTAPMSSRESVDGELALRAIAMPAFANSHGDIFGGWLLSQMDLAGGSVATRLAKGRVVTVAITAMGFQHPVFVGDEMSCCASVTTVGHTSIAVRVESFARRGRTGDTINQSDGGTLHLRGSRLELKTSSSVRSNSGRVILLDSGFVQRRVVAPSKSQPLPPVCPRTPSGYGGIAEAPSDTSSHFHPARCAIRFLRTNLHEPLLQQRVGI